ncbi:hypothetical protein I6U52_23210 [Serratia marcescens]|nr:hypothetical protein [Serratia marcescens]MBW4238503.1 hypothetical protein [Enterobacter roggenkampii]
MNILKLQTTYIKDIEMIFISDDYYFNRAIKESGIFPNAKFEFIDNTRKINECLDNYFISGDEKQYIIAIENLVYLKKILNGNYLTGKKILFIIDTPLSKMILPVPKYWVCSKYLNLTQLRYVIKYKTSNFKIPNIVTLTTTEKKILTLYIKGIPLKEIAMLCGISLKKAYAIRYSVINKVEFSRKGTLPLLKYMHIFSIL